MRSSDINLVNMPNMAFLSRVSTIHFFVGWFFNIPKCDFSVAQRGHSEQMKCRKTIYRPRLCHMTPLGEFRASHPLPLPKNQPPSRPFTPRALAFRAFYFTQVVSETLPNSFLSRVSSTVTRDTDIGSLSVCPSVRHVLVFYGTGLTCCHSFFITHCSFMNIKYFCEIPTESPLPGVLKYRWGIKISRFSTNNLLYLANDTR